MLALIRARDAKTRYVKGMRKMSLADTTAEKKWRTSLKSDFRKTQASGTQSELDSYIRRERKKERAGLLDVIRVLCQEEETGKRQRGKKSSPRNSARVKNRCNKLRIPEHIVGVAVNESAVLHRRGRRRRHSSSGGGGDDADASFGMVDATIGWWSGIGSRTSQKIELCSKWHRDEARSTTATRRESLVDNGDDAEHHLKRSMRELRAGERDRVGRSDKSGFARPRQRRSGSTAAGQSCLQVRRSWDDKRLRESERKRLMFEHYRASEPFCCRGSRASGSRLKDDASALSGKGNRRPGDSSDVMCWTPNGLNTDGGGTSSAEVRYDAVGVDENRIEGKPKDM
ncbi:hypothetical protein R3P38DRAFT_2815293 [Favolaschia claudopus]|uniref:Uncharacterized protein n=1 Tax=Favolaschia claudopus TaxID=2862362 RepID=A0AAV9Z205_9AGAR